MRSGKQPGADIRSSNPGVRKQTLRMCRFRSGFRVYGISLKMMPVVSIVPFGAPPDAGE